MNGIDEMIAQNLKRPDGKQGGTWYIGVDPGLHGALALVDDVSGRLLACVDMPTVVKSSETRTVKGKDGKPDRRVTSERLMVSPHMLARQIDEWCSAAEVAGRRIVAVIEEVQSMPRDGAVGAFAFGKSAGLIEGVIAAAWIPIEMIRPSVWKKKAGLTADKAVAIRKAQERFPTHVHLFMRKKDDGRAEASILASWAASRKGGSHDH